MGGRPAPSAALKIEIQRLQLQIRNEVAVNEKHLAWMEGVVDQLAVALRECQDREVAKQ